MSVMSLKEYARVSNVSYEAVRQQVKRYASELEGHVHREGRQQFLDDEAIAFLDGKRQKNPVVIYQASKDDELEDLRAENTKLLKELAGAKDLLLQNSTAVAMLASAEKENEKLESKVEQLEVDLKAARDKIDEVNNKRIEAEQRRLGAEKELIQKEVDLERLMNAGFWERRKILKDLKKRNKE